MVYLSGPGGGLASLAVDAWRVKAVPLMAMTIESNPNTQRRVMYTYLMLTL
jgi:hypothetical protein